MPTGFGLRPSRESAGRATEPYRLRASPRLYYNFAKFRNAPAHACDVIVQEGGNVISVSVLIVGTSPVPHVHPSPRRRRRRGDPQTKRGCMHQPEP